MWTQYKKHYYMHLPLKYNILIIDACSQVSKAKIVRNYINTQFSRNTVHKSIFRGFLSKFQNKAHGTIIIF